MNSCEGVPFDRAPHIMLNWTIVVPISPYNMIHIDKIDLKTRRIKNPQFVNQEEKHSEFCICIICKQ